MQLLQDWPLRRSKPYWNHWMVACTRPDKSGTKRIQSTGWLSCGVSTLPIQSASVQTWTNRRNFAGLEANTLCPLHCFPNCSKPVCSCSTGCLSIVVVVAVLAYLDLPEVFNELCDLLFACVQRNPQSVVKTSKLWNRLEKIYWILA